MRYAGAEFTITGIVSLKQAPDSYAGRRAYQVIDGVAPGRNAYFLIKIAWSTARIMYVVTNNYSTYEVNRRSNPSMLVTTFKHSYQYHSVALELIKQYTDSLE